MARISLGSPAEISDGGAYCTAPKVIILDQQLYVFWHESIGIYGRRREGVQPQAKIMFRLSQDGGLTFGDSKCLYEFEARVHSSPSLAVTPNSKELFGCWSDIDDTESSPYKTKILVAKNALDSTHGIFDRSVYLDGEGAARRSIALQHSEDADGAGPDRIQDRRRTRFSRRAHSPPPELTIADGRLYVMWVGVTDLLAGSPEAAASDRMHVECTIRFAASADNGNSFGEIVNLGSYRIRDQGMAATIKLRAKNDNVYAMWYHPNRAGTAYSWTLRKSKDHGRNFADPVLMDGIRYEGQPESSEARLGDIAAVCDNEDQKSSQADLSDFIATWIVSEKPEPSPARFTPFPDLGSSSLYAARVHLDHNNILHFKSIASIAERMQLGTDAPLRTSGCNVHILCKENGGKEGFVLRSSKDNGRTFGTELVVAGSTTNSLDGRVGKYPMIVTCGDGVFVSWVNVLERERASDQRPSPPGSVIYLSASIDSQAFLEPLRISVSEHAHSCQLYFIVQNENLYFVWAEGEEESPKVWFRKGTISS